MRYTDRNKRTYIIVGLCMVLAIMIVGYAAFATNLKINTTSEIIVFGMSI